MNHAKDLKEIEKVVTYEANKIFEIWKHPKFIPRMFKYLAFLKESKPKLWKIDEYKNAHNL